LIISLLIWNEIKCIYIRVRCKCCIIIIKYLIIKYKHAQPGNNNIGKMVNYGPRVSIRTIILLCRSYDINKWLLRNDFPTSHIDTSAFPSPRCRTRSMNTCYYIIGTANRAESVGFHHTLSSPHHTKNFGIIYYAACNKLMSDNNIKI